MKIKNYVLLLFILLGWHGVRSQTIDTLISVGKHHLHFKIIKGDNRLPVLFESGNGDDGSVWESLLDLLHQALPRPF